MVQEWKTRRSQSQRSRLQDEDASVNSGMSLTSEMTVYTSAPESPVTSQFPESPLLQTNFSNSNFEVSNITTKEIFTHPQVLPPASSWTVVQHPRSKGNILAIKKTIFKFEVFLI